ncbi:MAG: AAA family ATPase [Chloroflexota bacterium]|nr:AAA family ATPase [Chloroflexota bacterium]
MPTPQDQITQLEAAIVAQEALRPTLGDAVVDVTVTALRAQLDEVRSEQEAPAQPQAELSPEQLLGRLQSYLPTELADKIRATGRIEDERRQVTVLFADLSGFTALSERLDPEEVMALANDMLKELAEAVYQYEGYIDKFVGDAIMAVFGAPVAHEDDPERALRAVLAMRERMEDFNRRWAERLGEPLQLHIGINTGTAIACTVGSDLRMSYTVIGDTVNLASRLQDVAEPGQILVSRDTYRLTQEAFTFLALDPIMIRGKREPVPVFELQRAKLFPGKVRGLKELSSALIGREREMAQLGAIMQDLEAGRGRVVTIAGEAGIGKSRLIAEWHATIGDRARWLEGRAFAHTTALAYGPFLDLFRRYAGIKDDDSEIQARTRLRTAVDRLFPGNVEAHAMFANLLAMRLSPEESALLAPYPAAALRRQLFGLVEELFTRLAQERPAVLVIEDMHWADLASIELVEYLLPLTKRLPIAIVGVFRQHPDEAPRILQAVAEVSYADRFTHIPLAPLSEASSLEMVERLLSMHALPEPLEKMIQEKAEGNPFFVEEVIRSLIERGALVRDESSEGWVATPLIETIVVPDTLQGVLMARLDRLPDETKRVMQYAAIIGRVFLYRVLLQMAENATSLDADLSHLEREELIRERARQPEIEYIFKHALTQEVAYNTLLAPRRRELHRKVGEAMESIFAERLGEFSSIIGEHFYRGEAWDKAVDYLSRAGDAAARLYAHTEARLHYARALEALSHLPDTEDNRRRRVDLIIPLASVSFSDDPEQNLVRLKEAEALAQALPGPDGQPGTDRLRLAHIHHWMGRSHHYRGELREAVGYFREVLAVAHEVGDEDLAAIPASVIGRVLGVQGQYGKARAVLAPAIRTLEKNGNWNEWVFAVGYLGLAIAGRGDYAAGLAEARRALACARETNYPTGIAATHLLLFFIYATGGDAPHMLEESRASIEAAEHSGDRVYVHVGLGFRAWAESQLGQHEAARQSLLQSDAVGQSLGGRIVLADVLAAIKADITFNAGRVEEALNLAEQAATVGHAVGGVFAEALAHRVWGQALAALTPPRWDEAEGHMASSVEIFEANENLLEAARTHASWGLVCRDRDAPDRAREHLLQAAARYEAAGLAAELERTRRWIEGLQ